MYPLVAGYDHRFVLALVGHEPALEHMFSAVARRAARQLSGIANAAFHNDPDVPATAMVPSDWRNV